MFHPKVVIYFRLEVMLQIFLDHLVRHITRGHAKIAPRPEMPSPIAFFYSGKLSNSFDELRPLILRIISLGAIFGGVETNRCT